MPEPSSSGADDPRDEAQPPSDRPSPSNNISSTHRLGAAPSSTRSSRVRGWSSLIDAIRTDQKRRWLRGDRVPIETYLKPDGASDPIDGDAMLDLIYSEVCLREELGEQASLEEYVARFPAFSEQLRRQFEVHTALTESPGADAGGDAADEHRQAGGGATPSLPEYDELPEVDGYEVLAEVGRGGMGIVYQARQCRLDRIVALKMVRSGEDVRPTDLVRFLSEAETIAALQHSNIVQVFEVGHERGRLYLCMEYVPGGSLHQHLDGQPFEPRRAATIGESIARAVHFAHEHGIVHRDLKPGNILLAADGQPKITDFGLAMTLGAENDLTRTGEIVGTPGYMSPEQASGSKRGIGPATDIHALGAILYHLLTGQQPFKGLTVLDTLDLIRHAEPLPPRRLQPAVPQDLEIICLKCLRKEPSRRYATALELAEDLRRFLNDEPIRARPVTQAERLWRWSRRNPLLAGMSAALILALMAGFCVSTLLMLHAESQRALAELRRKEADSQKEAAQASSLQAQKEAQRATHMAEVLAGMLETADPIGLDGLPFYIPRQTGEDLTAAEILRRGTDRIRKDLAQQPETLALLLTKIGSVYLTRGEHRLAGPLLEEALRLHGASALPDDHPALAGTRHQLGCYYHELGDYTRAHDLLERALQVRRQHAETDPVPYAATLFRLGWLLIQMEEFNQAEEALRQVIRFRKEHLPEDQRSLALAYIGLAALYIDRGDSLKAVLPVAASYRLMSQSDGDPLVGKIAELFQAGCVQRDVPLLLPSAERKLQESVDLAVKALGPNHPFIALLLHELASTQVRRGKLAAAEENFRKCLETVRTSQLQAHPKATVLLRTYGSLLLRLGKHAEADRLCEEVISAREARFGRSHHLFADALLAHAQLLRDRGDERRAEELMRRGSAIYLSPENARRTGALDCLHDLALAILYQKPAEAETMVRRALELAETPSPPRHRYRGELLVTLARALLLQKKFAEAELALHQARAAHAAHGAEMQAEDQFWLQQMLAEAYRGLGRPNDAMAAAVEGRKLAGDDAGLLLQIACECSRCLPMFTDPTEADRCAVQALETLRLSLAADPALRSRIRSEPALAPLRQRSGFAQLMAE